MTLLPTATKMAEYEEETVPSILLPCASCNRTFRPEALAKHTKYCEKTLIKKRKVFDSAKQRIQGTDLAEFLPVLTHKKKIEKSPIRKTQSKWKEKHMELVRAIRAARVNPSADDPPPAPMKPSDHEQCPHCDRYFGPKAYDRHLEWCKEHSSRIQPKSPASIQAKERLEARTKYRAPMSIKSRRNSSRDKYQPQSGHHVRDPSPMEPMQRRMSTRTREPSPMERHRKNSFSSQPSPKQPGSSRGDSNNMDSLSRNQPHRNSKRNPSPMKKTSTGVRSKNDTSNNLSQKEVQLNDMNLNYETSHQLKNDIFSASCNITSIKPKEGMKPKMKMKMAAISAVTAPTTPSTPTTTNHNSSSPAAAPQFESNNVNNGDSKKLQTLQHSSGNKFSTDSAYNSLNRKSPQLDDSATMENTDFMQLGSSSGSESSFPSISKQNSQVARFCHECGTKYPVLGAKFCCQCGVRRLVI